MAFIELNSISKCYAVGEERVFALREVSLSIEEGDFVAIMGPSGSGKTTLLSILGGLCRPSGGKYTIDGISLYDLDEEKLADFRREYVGFVFQSFHLIPYLTVIENVMLPMAVVWGQKSFKRKNALLLLEQMGLTSKERRLPTRLSGGEQERVAIARALINDPPLILADEPTGNLDSKTGKEIMELLRKLNAEGRTIIMVTHNSENAAFARRLIRLRDGLIEGEELVSLKWVKRLPVGEIF